VYCGAVEPLSHLRYALESSEMMFEINFHMLYYVFMYHFHMMHGTCSSTRFGGNCLCFFVAGVPRLARGVAMLDSRFGG
jgi:hypothetical protein